MWGIILYIIGGVIIFLSLMKDIVNPISEWIFTFILYFTLVYWILYIVGLTIVYSLHYLIWTIRQKITKKSHNSD